MSQLGSSSSHQLLAASVAFRRARRKFPKNFGAQSSLGKSLEQIQGVPATVDDGNHETESTISSLKTAAEPKVNAEISSLCGSESSDYRSVKENAPSLPSSRRCCRRHTGREENEESARETSNIAKTCYEVDRTVDMIPCRDTDCKKTDDQPRRDQTYLDVPSTGIKENYQKPENSAFHRCLRDPQSLESKLQKVNFCACNACRANENFACRFISHQRPHVDENRSLDSIRKVCKCKDRIHQHSWINSKRLASQSQHTKFTSRKCNCRSNTNLIFPITAHNNYRKSCGQYRCDCQYWCRHCCSHHFHCSQQNRPAESNSFSGLANVHTYLTRGRRNCSCTLNHRAKNDRHCLFGDKIHEAQAGTRNDEDPVSVLMGRCGIHCQHKNDVFYSDFKVFSEDGNFHTGDNFNSGITDEPDSCRNAARLEYQGRIHDNNCACHESSLTSAGKTCCAEFDRIRGDGDFTGINRFRCSSMKTGTC